MGPEQFAKEVNRLGMERGRKAGVVDLLLYHCVRWPCVFSSASESSCIIVMHQTPDQPCPCCA